MAKAKAPKKPKKPRTLRQWLEPKLRNIARQWPEKNEARAKAARRVQDSFFKNGKPKFITKFECAKCLELFDKEDTQMDHTIPVVSTEDGFVDWNNYMPRLFCLADNYSCLCKPCHLLKTLSEGEARVVHRKKKSNV